MTLEKSVSIAVTSNAVFNALTSPQEIVKHFPFEAVTSDCREDGEITFQGAVNGVPFTDYGRITRFEPGKAFAYRYWSTNHGTERRPENELEVRYEIVAGQDQTHLKVVQDRISSPDYFDMMNTAWDHLLGALKQNLESRS
ncbi:MAG: SRPBCC domain-containing protein [Roseibium sp.]|uniref:SRPBCC family protein n=1 Tax=Roseibium sp. TaxID=1936156 RepID=UPI001B1F9B61|nr:SRPBCC domain-containing protein [Roseibium sp.]MBO6894269.1 SRPBCC domain-containing protein [Roseibium sp.]MBO6933259.1 SRPBCC domain-containing protein [Roseibium sp.]